jgi:hypothetical protein
VGILGPAANVANPSAMGGIAEALWTPSTGGPKTLYVTAVDRAGRKATKVVQFYVAPPSPVLARWNLDEPAGTTSLADSTGRGHTATLNGATLGISGRIAGGPTSAAFANAPNNYAAATVPELITSRGFSVAAWVKPNSNITGNRAVVSKDGTHTSGFRLQISAACGCWSIALNATDALNPTSSGVNGPVAVPGVWAHVVGIYDDATNRVYLYVNGGLVASAGVPAPTWNATGPLVIGRARWNDGPTDALVGAVSEVQVWNRMITSAEVAALADPLAVGNVRRMAHGRGRPGSGVRRLADGA